MDLNVNASEFLFKPKGGHNLKLKTPGLPFLLNNQISKIITFW